MTLLLRQPPRTAVALVMAALEARLDSKPSPLQGELEVSRAIPRYRVEPDAIPAIARARPIGWDFLVLGENTAVASCTTKGRQFSFSGITLGTFAEALLAGCGLAQDVFEPPIGRFQVFLAEAEKSMRVSLVLQARAHNHVIDLINGVVILPQQLEHRLVAR